VSTVALVLAAAGVVVAGLMAAWVRRRRHLAPAPPFGRRSLRRSANHQLGVGHLEQLRQTARGPVRAFAHVLVPAALIALVLLPCWRINFAPFNKAADSKTYLGTAWQVVAAAVGVSVALIAFVFEAFMSSGERHFGGTLRQFTDHTGLLWLFDIAAASLIVDGLVLAGVGSGAPGGWAGFAAAVLSGVTLTGLLVVVPRAIVRILDPVRLLSMRRRRARRVIALTIREQLIGQVIATELHQREAETQIAPNPFARGDKNTNVLAGHGGVLRDVRLGPLWRAVRRLNADPAARLELPVDVDRTVSAGTTLAVSPVELGRARRWDLRRGFRVAYRGEPASIALRRALEQVQRQAIDAVARNDANEWRELSRLLNEQLVELVTQSARLGLPFEGAVSDPGLLRDGPAAAIFDVFDEVLRKALRDGADEIVHIVLALPQSLAYDIRDFDAGGLIARMAGLYSRVLYLTFTGVLAERLADPARDELRRTAIDELFELVQRVGGHALGHEAPAADDLRRAVTNVRRAMSVVPGVLRNLVTRRDERAFRRALRGWHEVIEFWDDWRPGERAAAQQELLYDMRAVYVAVAAWALDLLMTPDPERPEVLREMARTLLVGVSPGELVRAYHDLARRRQRFGDDISWWWYDEDRGGVQSLDAESRVAAAVVVGLALRAQSEMPAIPPEVALGYEYARIEAAIGRVRERGIAIGSDVVAVLDAVAGALRQAHDREERVSREQVIAGELDTGRVEAFKRGVREAAVSQRVLVHALKARGRWHEFSTVTPRPVLTMASKPAFMDRPEHVGQQTIARTLGNRAGLYELRDLVTALQGLPASEAAEPRAGVTAALTSLRDAAGQPDLIIVGVDWSWYEALALVPGGGSPAPASVTDDRALAEKAIGVFDGVLVLQHPDLSDRALVVDLDCVRMGEEPTEDSSGVRVDVRTFGADSARDWLVAQGSAVTADAIEHLRQQVLLSVDVLWRLALVDPTRARAVQIVTSGPPAGAA
jgi:hypothetical protein